MMKPDFDLKIGDHWGWKMFVLACFLVVMVFLVECCTSINKALNMQDDHVVEELFEEMIREKTGMSIDLTPESLE